MGAHLSRRGALTAGLDLYRANIDPTAYTARGGDGAARTDARRITCPTMGVWSSRDPFLTEAQIVGSGECVGGPWRYQRVDGDHWMPLQAPERLTGLLVEFLR